MTVTEYLDQLDQAREKATPGPWVQHPADLMYVIGDVSDGGESYLDVADTVAGAYPDAVLIVAAVNALPKLTAALRGVLVLADEMERRGDNAAAIPEMRLAGRAYQGSATRVRAAITAALGGAV